MRVTALAGFLAWVTIAVSSSPVGAQALDPLKSNTPDRPQSKITLLAALEPQVKKEEQKAEPLPPQPEPKLHTVKQHETLSAIAEQYQTTWIRLFNKNEQIAHPDVIDVGNQLTIPLPDEPLPERPLPLPPAPAPEPAAAAPAPAPATPRRTSPAPAAATAPRGGSAGNTYTPGYCTWYAKNRRPDLPNNLGNADTWAARAAAQGIPTGYTPRAGAIGQQGMHVVYVERVNGDGTVLISEMNYRGLYIISTRTVAAGAFVYIY